MNKHLIFTNGRSGSNYLVNLLNKHPEIVNFGEVLGDWTLPYKLHTRLGLGGKSDIQYLDNIYENPTFFYMAEFFSFLSHINKRKKPVVKIRNNLSSIGIKDFSINFNRLSLLGYLADHKDILIINLYRKNQLKRFVSLEMMNKSGVVFLDKNNKVHGPSKSKKKKLCIQKDDIIDNMIIYQKEFEEQMSFANSLSKSRVLNIQFEDLFKSDESKYEYSLKLFNFLEVDPVHIESSHSKILPDKLSDLIENYDEIYSTLINTRFSSFLDPM